MPPRILTDTMVCYDEGIQIGTLFGVKALLSKLSLVLPIVIAFPILDAVCLDCADGNYTMIYEWSLILLYSVLPVIFKIPAAMMLQRNC